MSGGGLKSLQVSVSNWEEKPGCKVEESQDQLEHSFKKALKSSWNSSPLSLTTAEAQMPSRSRHPSPWNRCRPGSRLRRAEGGNPVGFPPRRWARGPAATGGGHRDAWPSIPPSRVMEASSLPAPRSHAEVFCGQPSSGAIEGREF